MFKLVTAGASENIKNRKAVNIASGVGKKWLLKAHRLQLRLLAA